MPPMCGGRSDGIGQQSVEAAVLRVAFSIGPGGGLQGVRIVRSSGKQAADQAAIATVRAAAPLPGAPRHINNTFSIQIYFR